MPSTTHYQTLGVAPAATQDQIKRAYRKLARRYHPDVSHEPDAERRFKQVAEAHEALIDPQRRAAYDESLLVASRPEARQAPNDRWSDVRTDGDFFNELFSRYRNHERGPAPMTGADHHARIEIDLADAYTGAVRKVTVRADEPDAHGHHALHARQIEINIPKGIREGQKLRLVGQGGAGSPGQHAGDLFLEVNWRAHPDFRVDGRDVYLTLPITPWEAALGATVMAPTPDGKVEVTIAPGAMGGRKLRLKGKGLPGAQGHVTGDLYAVLSIAVPPIHNAGEREAFAALAQVCKGFNPRAAWAPAMA
jgi:curved DNA-binding protein